MPGSSLVQAEKKGQEGKRCKRKQADTVTGQCDQLGSPCQDFAENFCALFNPPGPPRLTCAVAAILCCRPLELCQGEEFFDCLLGRIQSI